MTVVVPAEFGFLSLGETNNFDGALNPNRRESAIVFSTGSAQATVNISSVPEGNPSVQGADVDISLFRDLDNDRILDTDKDAKIGFGSGIESSETISQALSQGTYFVHITSITPAFIPFDVNISRQSSGAANPFTTPEFKLGRISEDLGKSGRIENENTADNYAFRLDGKSSLDIRVAERGTKKGDVNIRVVEDLNSDGDVDKGEIVARGVSFSKGNIDKISGLEGAGNYILQVCQTNGETPYGVRFDHTSI